MEKVKILAVGIGGYANVYLEELLAKADPDYEFVGMIDIAAEQCKFYPRLRELGVPRFSSMGGILRIPSGRPGHRHHPHSLPHPADSLRPAPRLQRHVRKAPVRRLRRRGRAGAGHPGNGEIRHHRLPVELRSAHSEPEAGHFRRGLRQGGIPEKFGVLPGPRSISPGAAAGAADPDARRAISSTTAWSATPPPITCTICSMSPRAPPGKVGGRLS